MRILLIFSLFLIAGSLVAQRRSPYQQKERSNEGKILLVNAYYGYHWPGEDMAVRFGPNFSTGGSLDLLTKGNFLVGAEATYIFGNNVNTDVLEPLRDEDGLIFDGGGAIAEIRLRERGLFLGGHVGKIFPVFGVNARSGIRTTIGAGFFQHRIRIQDDPLAVVPNLNDDYKKGYDRLTNGFALTEFIGYQFLADNRLVNFLIGLELTQGFTQSRRSFNFDTRSRDTDRRLDFLYGIRVGWTLPLYIGENPDEIRY